MWPVPDYALDAARECGIAMLTVRHLEDSLFAFQARRGGGRRRQIEASLESRPRKARISKLLLERTLAKLAPKGKPLDLARQLSQREES